MGKKENITKKHSNKHPNLGLIPDSWEVHRFADVFEFLPTNSFSRDQMTYGGDQNSIYNIHYGDIHATFNEQILDFNKHIHQIPILLDTTEVRSNDNAFLKDGDLIIADASEDYDGVGECIEITGINKRKVLGGLHTITARDLIGKTVQGFRAYLLKNQRVFINLKKLATGSKVYGVSKGNVAELELVIPPIPEQQKIARILCTWDKTIEKTELLIAQKQQLKKGLMQQLLTGKVRFKEFKDKWKKVNLRDVAVFENGKAHENCIVDDGRYTVVTSKFISTNGIEYRSSDQNLSPLRKGDITMVMSDVPNGKALAKCFLIHEDDRYTLNQRICSIRPDRINTEFLLYQLNRNKYFMQFDNGVAQTNLRKDEVLDCPIDLPTDSEQKRISKLIGAVNTELDELNKMLINLESQKKGLMQKLLTGEVRVRIN